MKVEKVKQGSVGGLLHLFDWNMKSQQSKQKRSSDSNIPITKFDLSKGNMAGGLILKGGSSSLIDEDDYRKVPGVVARLMGLDSLPTSSFTDTHSNRTFDSRYVQKRIEFERNDYNQIDRKQKVIEKFQTDILPPKSAKSVPVTQQKLLSTIKSSKFMSSDDSVRIMEVASKIQSRKPSSRRPIESNAARNLRGQSMNKSWDGCLERKPLPEDEKKSVSLALQAKLNVKKREGSSTPKKPSTNSALKQNNLKQNFVNGREKSVIKSPVSSTNSQCRKPISGKGSIKIPANSTNKTVNQRKRDTNDRSSNVGKSNGSDVVSFTFTSPISRSSTEKKNAFLADTHGKNLKTLLDQKLKELIATNYKAQVNRTTIIENKRNPVRFHKDDSYSDFSSVFQSSSINPLFKGQEHVAVFSKKPTTMEVEIESDSSYVNRILSDIESMFEDFTLGRTHKIVNPRLFGQLEGQRPLIRKDNEFKLRRKLVFDCVSECVDSRCRVWTRGLLVVTRKKYLVKEVCNKILGYEKMKDCMVDDLVDKDMSSDEYQKWLDFGVEAFELGVDIERRLLSFLINEAVVDILVH